jgi:uncharacterized DUF497 family protein
VVRFAGFDWDEGNRDKCQKHGVSIADIEGLFAGAEVMIRPDVAHSRTETRFLAIGQSPAGQFILVAFTIREMDGDRRLRPISARRMHQKEIDYYEKSRS